MMMCVKLFNILKIITKIMISYKQFLLEAKQTGTLFHYTFPDSAINILNDNTLKHGMYNKFISLTRKRNLHKYKLDFNDNKFPRVNSVGVHVSFEIDGDKLSQNHKISPFNFFSSRYFGKAHGDGFEDRANEQEERIVGRNVNNFKSYIKKIRVHFPISDQDKNELEKHNIPIEYTP